MVTPLRNDTKYITSVTTENNLIRPAHSIIMNKDQERKEEIETYMISLMDEPNTMGYHRNMSIYFDEVRIKAYKPDQTNKIRNLFLIILYYLLPRKSFLQCPIYHDHQGSGERIGT